MNMQRAFDFGEAPVALDDGWWCFEDRMRAIRAGLLRCARLKDVPADSPWYVLEVVSGREKAVENALTEEKIECCVPMRKRREIRHRGRIIPAQTVPVMSGYVLVRCEQSNESFFALLGLDHVLGILGGWLTPHRVTDEEVKRFKEKAEAGAYDCPPDACRFKRGEAVLINNGPLAGLQGRFKAAVGQAGSDAVVELELLGRITPTIMPIAILDGI